MRDLKDAFRSLMATPVVTAVAVLSLALGIGANTAIFSILDSLILRTLPVKDPQRLALLDQRSRGPTPSGRRSRERQQPFDGAMAWSTTRFNLARRRPDRDGGRRLGERRLLRRAWHAAPFSVARSTPDDDRRGGGPDGPVAVISYTFWQRRFGGKRGRHRQAADGRAGALHHHRRHAAGVLRHRSRPNVRRGDSDRHRAAHSRQRKLAGPAIVLVAQHHGPPQARAEPRSGDNGIARRAAADPRSDDAAGLARSSTRRRTFRTPSPSCRRRPAARGCAAAINSR